MSHATHANHVHVHSPDCGHRAVLHDGHTDYLHDGHLHHHHEDHVDDHVLAVDATNPASCTPTHVCGGHDANHKHGENCGHASVPHGDHIDYVVRGHLHHPHSNHCDDHGALTLI